jgi:hypothetical protein
VALGAPCRRHVDFRPATCEDGSDEPASAGWRRGSHGDRERGGISASVDIRPRDGKHQVRWRDASGRRRARTFTRGRDATQFAAQVRTVLEGGGVLQLEHEIATLAAFVEEYWRVYALPNLAPNTREVYKRVWAKHVLPRLAT